MQIKYKGTRLLDYTEADKEMRRLLGDPSWKKPDDMIWHHHEQVGEAGGRMLLVPRRLHETVRHTGGIPRHRELTGLYDDYPKT